MVAQRPADASSLFFFSSEMESKRQAVNLVPAAIEPS